jgi:hypothetical protein
MIRIPPHPLPLPSGEKERVRGKFQISLIRIKEQESGQSILYGKLV